MISALLAERRLVAWLGLAAVVVVAPFVAAWLSSRRRVAWVLAALSWCVIAALTLTPGIRLGSRACLLRVTPVDLLGPEPLANVVLFVPPVLAMVAAGARPLRALLVASAASLLVELLQWAVVAIQRSCSTTDWLMNTTGAGLGAALAALGLLLRRRRARGARRVPIRR